MALLDENKKNVVTLEDLKVFKDCMDETSTPILDTYEDVQATVEPGTTVDTVVIKQIEADLKKSVADGKASIASAMTNKGVPTPADATFTILTNKVDEVYNKGKSDADARINVTSDNYKGGYSAGQTDTTALVKTSVKRYDSTAESLGIITNATVANQYIDKAYNKGVSSGAGSVTLSGVTNGSTLGYSTNYAVTASNGKSIGFKTPADRYGTGVTDGANTLSLSGVSASDIMSGKTVTATTTRADGTTVAKSITGNVSVRTVGAQNYGEQHDKYFMNSSGYNVLEIALDTPYRAGEYVYFSENQILKCVSGSSTIFPPTGFGDTIHFIPNNNNIKMKQILISFQSSQNNNCYWNYTYINGVEKLTKSSIVGTWLTVHYRAYPDAYNADRVEIYVDNQSSTGQANALTGILYYSVIFE